MVTNQMLTRGWVMPGTVLIAAAYWFWCTAAFALDHPCRSEIVATGAPVPGSTISSLRLKGDVRRFKLSGLLVPGDDPALPKVRELSLHTMEKQPDRYGRIAVHAFSDSDGEWLQGQLLHQGRALQYALRSETECLGAMRAAERVARQSKVGMWQRQLVFSASKPDDLLQHTGEFVIVTGIVKSIGDRKRRLYLNFGSNWAEDVTATVVKKGSGAYRGDVAVLQRLEGKRVEIRGIVEDAQGPLIRLIDEAQIDILSR